MKSFELRCGERKKKRKKKKDSFPLFLKMTFETKLKKKCRVFPIIALLYSTGLISRKDISVLHGNRIHFERLNVNTVSLMTIGTPPGNSFFFLGTGVR